MLGRLSFRIVKGSIGVRFTSSTTESQASFQDSKANPLESALPFEDIPEPKSLPLIGTALDYTPFRGFDVKRVHEHWAKRHQQYDTVFCKTKEDTERLFRMEGRTPTRMFIQCISDIKDILGYPESLANERGEAWLRMRHPVNKMLLKKSGIWKYAKEQQQVCQEGVQYILKHRDENLEVVPKMGEFLEAWAFEAVATLVLNCRLGLLQEDAPSEVVEVFDGSRKMMEYIGANLIEGAFSFSSKTGLKRSLLRTKEILLSIIEEQKRSENLQNTFLDDMLKIESLSDIEKESLIMDMLLAAVETSANTMALCLYCVAMSSRVQDKLRAEIKSLTPEQRSSGRAIDGLSYMNAFFKEAHRILPFTHSLARTFDHDVVLSGFKIPAGTNITNTINSTANMNPEYFENPAECMPERWMDKTASKFQTTGPFGVGARACPGRFAAKQEIFLFLTEILSHFEVQYHHEPATSIMRATGVLSTEPRFAFVPLV